MSTKTIAGNFQAFSKRLLQNGIPLYTVNAIRERVNKFTGKGKDPNFTISRKGIVIEGKLFGLNFKPNENKEPGLGSVASIADIFGGGGSVWDKGKDILSMIPSTSGKTFGDVFNDGGGYSWDNAEKPSTSTNQYPGSANVNVEQPEGRRSYSTTPMPTATANTTQPVRQVQTSVRNTTTTDKKSNTGLLILGGVALVTLPFLFLMKKSPEAPVIKAT